MHARIPSSWQSTTRIFVNALQNCSKQEEENFDLRKENTALKLKLDEFGLKKSDESNGGEPKVDSSFHPADTLTHNRPPLSTTTTMADRDIETEVCEYVVGLFDADADLKWDLPDSPAPAKVVEGTTLLPTLAVRVVEPLISPGFDLPDTSAPAALKPCTLDHERCIPKELDAWTARYHELVAYKAEHGDCNVPRSYANQTLGRWVNTQRKAFKNGKLSDERVRKLDDIGFEGEPRKKNEHVSWTTRYDQLVSYKAEHGNCNVPQYYEANKSLGNWVHSQRTAFKVGKLSEDRVRKLNGIGFGWELRKQIDNVDWSKRYDELVAYKAEHGDCNVKSYANKKLAKWVSTQRTLFKNGNLSEERVGKLNEIGFVWLLRKQFDNVDWATMAISLKSVSRS